MVKEPARQTEYFDTLAAAFIRGKLQNTAVKETHPALFGRPLDTLADEDLQAIIQLGLLHELRIHRFKRTMELARVHKVLGMLKGMQPRHLLDIGSGRGAFLWPLLYTFPYLAVTAVDILAYRIADIQAVQAGGIQQLTGCQADVSELPFADQTFDIVSMLEVLEHIPAASQALQEACRVARKFVIISVPSKEDNNPEHIHLFDQQRLKHMLAEQGITRVSIDYVPNHIIAVARMERA